MIVAIDGPAGAGKSSVARALAERLGFRYLDTGAMYRAVAWLALERGARLEDEEAIAQLARAFPVEFEDGRVLVDGHDVTADIRAERIDRVVSTVARHGAVRQIMRERQRDLSQTGDAVVEGRDIGTVVCPGADVKVFLVADPDERARRRHAERPDADGDGLATDLRLRDEQDAMQTQKAADAVEIDTTGLTLHEVVVRIESLVTASSR